MFVASKQTSEPSEKAQIPPGPPIRMRTLRQAVNKTCIPRSAFLRSKNLFLQQEKTNRSNGGDNALQSKTHKFCSATAACIYQHETVVHRSQTENAIYAHILQVIPRPTDMQLLLIRSFTKSIFVRVLFRRRGMAAQHGEGSSRKRQFWASFCA